MKKKSSFLALVVLSLCVGCSNSANSSSNSEPGNSPSESSNTPSTPINAEYPVLNYKGNLDICAYIEGQNGIIEDIGNADFYAAEDLTDSAMVRYTSAAREFNKIYPDITINLHYTSISEYMNYVANYNGINKHLPHIMHLVTPPQQGLYSGLNADLAKYDYISYYNLIQEEYWDYFTFGDFVCAVPFMIYPTGLFINTKELENYYYDMNEEFMNEWTFDKMIEIAQSVYSEGNFGGLGQMNDALLNCMAPSINKQLIEDRSVDFSSLDVMAALAKENELAKYSVHDYVEGKVKDSFFQNGVYSYAANENFIWDEKYLMEVSRPFCALLYSYMMAERNKQNDFDYLPYPRLTEDGEMSIGMIGEGLVVGNQCPVDASGTPKCYNGEEGALAEEAAATFAMFMVADTKSVTALSETDWTIYGMTVNGDTNLPVIKDGFNYSYNTSEKTDYEIQMEIYMNEYASFKDKIGFQALMDILQNHPEQTFAYNTMLRSVPSPSQDGEVDILNGWNGRYRSYQTKITEDSWVGYITSLLPDWTANTNSNIDLTYLLLQEKLDTYYETGKYNVVPE